MKWKTMNKSFDQPIGFRVVNGLTSMVAELVKDFVFIS
jgi:hypothetical protein